MVRVIPLCFAMLTAACGSQPAANDVTSAETVQTSIKLEVPVAKVPPEVMAVALDRVPDLKLASAESETRGGRHYFDIGGTTADGAEIELDIMEEGGLWRVVETQRDIAFNEAPRPVREAARGQAPSFAPTRIIESRQEDGLVIYELYGPAGSNLQGRKVEVKWDGREASVLTEEWPH